MFSKAKHEFFFQISQWLTEWAQKFKFLQNSCRGKWFHKTELRDLYLYYPATVRNITLWFLFETECSWNLKLTNPIDNNGLYTRLTNAWRGSTLVSLHYKWVEPGYIIDHNLLQLLTRKPKLTRYFHEILFNIIWFSYHKGSEMIYFYFSKYEA